MNATTGTSDCLDDDSVLAYAEGSIEASRRASVEVHLDRCAACRQLVSALARSEPAEASAEDDERPLSLRDSLGRFIVLGILGVGGMGTVYSAYDPRLDRKVAIKVLRRRHVRATATADTPLLVEGKAMAQITHPNVVAVYDVSAHGRSLFIAMEFVEGRSLRRWLDEAPRSTGELLAVFVEAGRGLAAAHAVGLVHRDFKPDNVLIAKDGRIKVTDFGLAEMVRPNDGGAPVSIGGTPAYMSPEQRAGKSLDARSDQYSFAVTLLDALCGERPAMSGEGPLRLSGRTARRIPLTTRRAIERALAKDKDDRFATMEAFLDELAHAPRRRARWTAVIVILATSLAAVAWFGHRARTARTRECLAFGDDVQGIWNDGARAAIREKLAAHGRRFGRDTWPALERSIDAFAAELAGEERTACAATRVEKTQSEEALALRSSCLARRRFELRALVDLLADADATVVENAIVAAAKLTPIDACRSTITLAVQPLPPDAPAVRADVERQRIRLAEVKALLDAGRYRAGLEKVNECTSAADRIGYAPLQAEALYLQASLRDEVSDLEGAESALHRAAELAEVSRYDEVAAKARTLLVWIVGYRRARHEVGHALEHAARSAVLRAGDRADLEAPLENNAGTILWAEGKYGEAAARYERARQRWAQAFGEEHPLVADAINNRGLTLWNEGDLEGARASHETALELRTKLLGPEHPSVASSLNNLGLVEQELERFVEARDHHERAIAIQTAAHGEQHPLVASAWNNLGLAELGLGHNDTALAAIRHALDIRTSTRPDAHPDIANSLVNLALGYAAIGQPERGLDAVVDARLRQTAALGPEHPTLVDTLLVEARLLRTVGRPTDAIDRARRAQALARSRLGSTHPLLMAALFEEGAALLTQGRSGDATARLRPVIGQAAVLHDSLLVGAAALKLAQAQSSTNQHPEEAHELLDLARRRLERAGARGRPYLLEIARFSADRENRNH